MTLEELKAKFEGIETANADLKTKNADLEAKLAEKDTAINNLDASVKEQEKSIAALRESVKAGKATDWKAALRIAMEEKKAELEAHMDADEHFQFSVSGTGIDLFLNFANI